MNILTFDIEEWFHIPTHGAWTRPESEWDRFSPRIHANTDRLINLLLETGQRATFFCLGWVAAKHPDVIKKIHAAGFEIGSHSFGHQLIYEQSREEFRKDLERSVRTLEDLIGTKIRAYRAPSFSITARNAWALGILKENGIEIDCSIFPANREYGGFEGLGPMRPTLIEHEGILIKEFPINYHRIAMLRIIFSGGGYFRLLPYFLIRRMMTQASYVMTYFHPRDFDPGQPVISGLPWQRRFKSYYGLDSSFQKLERLLREFAFVDLRSADEAIDWTSQTTLRL